MIAPILPSDIDEIILNLGSDAQALTGKRILVTGGGGFLGTYFAAVFAGLNERALAKPCEVVILDNMITGDKNRPTPADSVFRFIDHDVIQPYTSDEPLDYVIHAAGIASPYYYRAYPLETLDVATTGTRNMLELARRHGARILFMSSSEIYGDPDSRHVPTPESYRGNVSCHGPRACYDESKRVGETLCYIYHERHGVPVNMVRPFNVFGPGMRASDYRVLPNFADRIVSGTPLQVYGTGRQTRTYCYVTDAMTGFIKALVGGVPGEVYNVGTPEPELSVHDLVKRIEQVLGRPVPHDVIEHPDSYPSDEPMRRCPDIRKARTQLDYEPKIDLDDGLKRFLDWAQVAYSRQGAG